MPSTTISTALIGYGLSGRVFHAPFLLADDRFDLRAIATSDPDRAADASRTGAEVTTTDDLIARGLDLVVLASPVHAHVEQALAALDAGSAVVVDKPFAPSVREAKALIAKSEAVGRPLMVFQNRRWDGDFLTVRGLVESGRLGDVHRFESTFERFSPARRDRWQDTRTPADGAGVLFDLGSHLVDQALQLFGPADLEHAELRTLREGAVSDDDAFLSLHHRSGVRSHLTMSRLAGQSGPRFRVLGSDAAYSVHGLDVQEPQLRSGTSPLDAGFGVVPEQDWGDLGVEGQLERVPTETGRYQEFYAGVASCLLDGAEPPVDVRDALEVVRIIERAHAISPLD
jgi:predicted dehydrogenase